MDALILVDIQNDFLPGGALAVPRGDEVVQPARRLQQRFDLVVATMDWHPENHCSFAANHPHCAPGDLVQVAGVRQRLWPVHCVQGTPGADLAAGLDQARIDHVVRKGIDPEADSYSGFYVAHGRASRLDEFLRGRGVQRVYIAGLASDVCVKATALDALAFGFRAICIEDACRAVGNQREAIESMREAGVAVTTSDAVYFSHSARRSTPSSTWPQQVRIISSESG